VPLPKALARSRLNRNLIGPVVSRLTLPHLPFAVVHHVGRTSGKEYATPVFAFPYGDGFAIALTYGPDVDWAENVQANGECRLQARGETHRLGNPRLVHGPEARRLTPPVIRQALWLIRVDSAMLLDPLPENPASQSDTD
jgi:deazaflavin-dependent oxidoreductase (nitroreductase family)